MLKLNRWITKLADLMSLGSAALTDARRHPRIETSLPVLLSGPLGTARVQCVEMSRGGVTVHTTEAVEIGTLVFLRMTSLGLMGFAHVRHCRADGDAHRLGLEFRDGLMRERTTEQGWDCRQVTTQLVWDEAEA